MGFVQRCIFLFILPYIVLSIFSFLEWHFYSVAVLFSNNNIRENKNIISVEESRQPWAGICLRPIVFFQKV